MIIFDSTRNKQKHTSKIVASDIVYIALFSALIAIFSQIQIPTAIPFTLQTFGVFITAGILGTRRSILSILIYILLGLVGAPVFSGFSGGVGILFGMRGGYIIGFLFTALIIGLSEKFFGKRILSLSISMIIGLLVCYAFGTIWYMAIMKTTFLAALSLCVLPYLIFDAVKIFAAVIVVRTLGKYAIYKK